MSLYRSGKSRGAGAGPIEKVAHVDLAARALDVQLASLAAAGDDSAFTTLVTRYQPAVFRWGLMFAHDPDEAEDIAQEVIVEFEKDPAAACCFPTLLGKHGEPLLDLKTPTGTVTVANYPDGKMKALLGTFEADNSAREGDDRPEAVARCFLVAAPGMLKLPTLPLVPLSKNGVGDRSRPLLKPVRCHETCSFAAVPRRANGFCRVHTRWCPNP